MTSASRPELAVLEDLLSWSPGPFVTLYLPFDPTRRDIERIELKAAVRSAHDALVDAGLTESQADEVLAPVQAQPLDGVERYRGVAWFCSPGHAASIRLAAPAGTAVSVGRTIDTLGLAPMIANDGTWFVLALSQNLVRMFRADRHSIEQLTVKGLPERLDDALWFVRREPTMERHGSGVMHMSDSGRELHKDDIRRFLHMVDGAIAPVLEGSTAPLVVMSVEYEAAMFINDTRYHHVVRTPVFGNPDALDAAAIRERSEVLGDLADRRCDIVLARAHELAGTGRVLYEPAEIADASARGVVQDLLVAREVTELPSVVGPLPEQRAVLAEAFTAAMATGASCVVADRADLPIEADMVAVVRY